MTTIGLLGATGYTGRLTTAELARRGITARLGGRNPDRLAALTPSENAHTAVVDTTDPKALAAFLDGLDAVISCVGPFVEHGDPVVDAAVEAGVPYVDSTGETTFIEGVYARHATAAVPVVPGCGFDYVPGDLAVAIAADKVGPGVTDVSVGYELRGTKASRGTARSAIGMVAQVQARPHRFRVAFPDRDAWAVEIPWGEAVTVPRQLPAARVRTGFTLPAAVAAAADAMAPFARFTVPLTRAARPLLERLIERMPEGPPDQARAGSRYRILAQVSSPSASARVLVEGGDLYGLTATLLVEAALRVARAGAPVGARTPAQALPPREFLDAVSGPTLCWRLV